MSFRVKKSFEKNPLIYSESNNFNPVSQKILAINIKSIKPTQMKYNKNKVKKLVHQLGRAFKMSHIRQRWEFLKEKKKVRKKERKHALDQESDQEKRKFLDSEKYESNLLSTT